MLPAIPEPKQTRTSSDAMQLMIQAENGGVLKIRSNDQIESEDEARRKNERDQNRPIILNIATYIKKHWEAAKNAKWVIEERLLKCLRQRKGLYDPTDLSAIQSFGGSEVFMMITNVKCRAIEAMIRDVMMPAGEKPWGINPTEIPDLPQEKNMEIADQVKNETIMIMSEYGPDVITPEMIDERMQEIKEDIRRKKNKITRQQTRNIEKKVEDTFEEGGMYREFSDFIRDFATFPTAFMKGPFIRRKKSLIWQPDPITGLSKPNIGNKNIRKYSRISPFDLYFAPGARDVNDGYVIERMRIRKSDIAAMKGISGFNDSAINSVLYEHSEGNLKDWLWTDSERANLQNRINEQEDPESIIEVLEYHGSIPGHLLIEWGIDGSKIDDPATPVDIVALLVGRWVVMARINDHPLGAHGYYGASFDKENDSIWGNAPAEIIEDCQRICNATARALVNNMAIASGPQVEVHRDRLDPGEDITRMWPWKVWKTRSDPSGRNQQAVHFYQPNALTAALFDVYAKFFEQAGEQLGIPAYEHGVGQDVTGAGRTAHGLSMLMNAASKIIKDAIVHIDTAVVKPLVYNTWLDLIISGDTTYQGDINVVARASEYLIQAEQLQARRNEWLMATNNPVDLAIVGMAGRGKVLRESSKVLKMQDNIIPTDQELETKFNQPQGQMQRSEMVPGGYGKAPENRNLPGILPQQNKLQKQLTPQLEQMANF